MGLTAKKGQEPVFLLVKSLTKAQSDNLNCLQAASMDTKMQSLLNFLTTSTKQIRTMKKS